MASASLGGPAATSAYDVARAIREAEVSHIIFRDELRFWLTSAVDFFIYSASDTLSITRVASADVAN
jgi:hypothetical protein